MAEHAFTLNQPEQSRNTNEAQIHSNAADFSDSSVKIPETSGISSAADDNKNVNDNQSVESLEFAGELMDKGKFAFKESDYSEAAELFSRALEIRVLHCGELAPECIQSYYKYGLALLNKAQEEADPFGALPKKDAESQLGSVKIKAAKNSVEVESSIASVSSRAKQGTSSTQQQGTDDVPENEEEDKDEESDMDELGEAEEDESDLDLAWKMLDLARVISEKHSQETMDMVDILSALAEVSLEREDVETAFSDYEKALSILERLVEPDSRHIAELNFRICLALEIGSKACEAIPYCERAISICKSRVKRLTDELKNTSESLSTSATSDVVDQGQGVHSSSVENPVSNQLEEIETLSSLASELEKKLEDLQQLESNPTSILSDILGLAAAKARINVEQASASSSRIGVVQNNGDFDSPTVSTAHNNGTGGVTHLGVVGRGVKRVIMSSSSIESSASKKPALDPKPDTGNSRAS